MMSIDNIYKKVLARISAKAAGFTDECGKTKKKPNIVSICGCKGGTAPSYSDVSFAPPAAMGSFAINTLTAPFLNLVSTSAKMLGSI